VKGDVDHISVENRQLKT